MTHPRALAIILALAVLAVAPAAASANGSLSAGIDSQLAFHGPDPGFPGSGDPTANANEAADALGAQTMRVHAVWWYSVLGEDRDGENDPATGLRCGRPPADRYDWRRLDNQLDQARRKGLRVILQLGGGFPCWASHNPSRCSLTAACVWKPNKRIYRQWVAAVMQHLKARGDVISRISPWNEPNNPEFLRASESTVTSEIRVRDSALAFRDLWFNAHDEIRAQGITTPLWFGDLQQSENAFRFTYDAFCYPNPDGTQPATANTEYMDCVDPRVEVQAEAMTFHTYLNENSPEDNLVYLRDLRRVWEKLRLANITRPSYFAITESGVHNNYTYAATGTTQARSDPRGKIRARNDNVAAAHLNCLEHNFYKDPRVVGFIQYLLHDGPDTGRTTDPLEDPGHFFTGLNRRDGSHKPQWVAWRMPLTVRRTAGATSTNLQAWGAYRPYAGGRPPAVTLVGMDAAGAVVFQRSITLTAPIPVDMKPPNGGYFRVDYTDVPTNAVQFETRANGITSRRARNGDCNQDTNRDGVLSNADKDAQEIWTGGDPLPTADSTK